MTSTDPGRNGVRGRFNESSLAFAMLAMTAIVFLGGIIWFDSLIRAWHERDVRRRAELVVRAIAFDVNSLSAAQLARQLEEISADDRIYGILVCTPGRRAIASPGLMRAVSCNSPLVLRAMGEPGSHVSGALEEYEVQVSAHAVSPDSLTRVVVFQDVGFIWSRRQDFLRMALIVGVISLLVFVILTYQGVRSARSRTLARLMEAFRTSRDGLPEDPDIPDDLSKIVEELRTSSARMAAARPASPLSGPEQLRRLVAERMPDTALVLVANREPYSHEREGDTIRVDRPASGLVTGVEPLLRATGGVWIAHGSGSADREMSDANGRVAVPPENPEYALRRVWLTESEQEGYYYGFANEGLWPLCHIAHTRPTFRSEDWHEYQKVNRRFAEAAAEEAGEHGLVLIQDYHFALLPQELRRLAPGTVSSLFWHIPWPNSEVVGILPWKREILAGMLGADVVGFHTRFHCLNFLETVNRYLEARVQLESMKVEYRGHLTRVRPYPISVRWPYPAANLAEGREMRSKFGIAEGARVAVGVDRADYTKGLLERIDAVEKLLESYPELVGEFVLVQIASPSRTHIARYRDFGLDVEAAVERVNRRFGGEGYRPIVLHMRSFSAEDVRRAYAMADVALITPLHDGMNLVAKEFVASRADEHGVLVLSVFTGAANELEGALLVNPYDAYEVSRALYEALMMSPDEQQARMQAMRRAIQKNTIYDWSASLLTDLAETWERRNALWRQEREAVGSGT
jgi:trehalose-6-phosphate synthase